MIRAAREGGKISTAAHCLLAFAGIEYPTPEQRAAAHLAAFAVHDLHILARALSKES